MMNCKVATQVMSQALDRPLRWRERLALRMHLLFCGGCSNFRRQMGFIRTACRRLADRD